MSIIKTLLLFLKTPLIRSLFVFIDETYEMKLKYSSGWTDQEKFPAMTEVKTFIKSSLYIPFD